jgi:hypothetical protein
MVAFVVLGLPLVILALTVAPDNFESVPIEAHSGDDTAEGAHEQLRSGGNGRSAGKAAPRSGLRLGEPGWDAANRGRYPNERAALDQSPTNSASASAPATASAATSTAAAYSATTGPGYATIPSASEAPGVGHQDMVTGDRQAAPNAQGGAGYAASGGVTQPSLPLATGTAVSEPGHSAGLAGRMTVEEGSDSIPPPDDGVSNAYFDAASAPAVAP